MSGRRTRAAKGVIGGVALSAAAASVASAAIVGIPAVASSGGDHEAAAPAPRAKGAHRSPGVLSGAKAPTARVGITGDFYIDTKAMRIYGPKKGRSWGKPTSLRGARGPAGAHGATGSAGVTGATGAAGSASATVDLAGQNWMTITAGEQFRMVASCATAGGQVAIGAYWKITDASANLAAPGDTIQIALEGPATDLSGFAGEAWSLVATWTPDPSFPAANAMIDMQPICVEGTLVRH